MIVYIIPYQKISPHEDWLCIYTYMLEYGQNRLGIRPILVIHKYMYNDILFSGNDGVDDGRVRPKSVIYIYMYYDILI